MLLAMKAQASSALVARIQMIQPDEEYDLAAQTDTTLYENIAMRTGSLTSGFPAGCDPGADALMGPSRRAWPDRAPTSP